MYYMDGPYRQCGHTLQVILRSLIGNLYALKGHSTIMWTKFYPILTPLEWTVVDILHHTYPLSRDQAWTFYWSLPPLLVHLVIEWSLISRYLLRFEYQLPHPILYTNFATDKKWPLSHFHISYQNSEISWQKMGLILVNKVL